MQTINRPRPSGPFKDGNGNGPLSTKGGSVAAAILAAALAAAAIVIFLDQYRDGINEDGVPTPVLVADKLIEQGASGDTIGSQRLLEASEVPRDQVKPGAITDAAVLRGQVAVKDILPGQQLTRADFRAAGNAVVTKLSPAQRAISVSLDRAHGLTGVVRTGDHVDVLTGFLVDTGFGRPRPYLRTLMQDVLVLKVPQEASGGGVTGGRGAGRANDTSQVTLRVAANRAPQVAFAAEYGKVWIVLRPQNGANVPRRTPVTVDSLLFDAKPVSTPPRRGRRGR